MQFPIPLVPGVLQRRYKRFFADVLLEGSGEGVTAHCPNTGTMKSVAQAGWRVWLSPANNPSRKLKWTWELTEVEDTLILVNTARPNGIVREAIEAGIIPELTGYGRIRGEVRYGEKSRIDLLLEESLEPGRPRCLVEVKNATMSMGEGMGAFPDAVTSRGRKHLHELTACVQKGDRAVQFFLVPREDVNILRPADEIDPAYGEALRAAVDAGVEVLAYRARVSATEVRVTERIPVQL